ncbi:MAG: hypothetical protein Q8P13_02150 [bacterium]|nr:hypothetical protein [bacterium]
MSTTRTREDLKELKLGVEEIAHTPGRGQVRDGYLNRLRRLLRLRKDHFDELNEQGLRLLDRSIFAAYCDCVDIDEGAAARKILKDVRLTLSLSSRPTSS